MSVFSGLVAVISAFLLGSVYFSQIIASRVFKQDICSTTDDGNPGAANVWKTCGRTWGIIAFLLDFMKGFAPVFIVNITVSNNPWLPFVMVAPVIGSGLGLFNHFHGGKSISVAFGVLAGVLPKFCGVLVLVACYLLFSVLLKVRPNGVGTIISFSLTALVSLFLAMFQGVMPLGIACCVVCLVVIFKHAVQLRNEMEVYRSNETGLESK